MLLFVTQLFYAQGVQYSKQYDILENMLDDINNLNYNDYYKTVAPILKDKKQHINGLNYMAKYYVEKEIPDSIISYGDKMYDLTINKEDSLSYSMLSQCYNMLAIAYGYKGLRQIRGAYHLKGIELYEKKLVDAYISAHHIRGLADYYNDEGIYEKAIPLYEESITLNKSSSTIYLSYNNLGLIYTHIGQYDKALFYLEKIKEAPEGLKVKGFYLVNLSKCHYKMGNLDKAIHYGEIAKEQFGKNNRNSKFILDLDNNIAKSYAKKKQYKKASSIFNTALQNAKQHGFIDMQIKLYRNLSQLFFDQGNYKDAYQYTVSGNRLKDSLLQIQKHQNADLLVSQFQIFRKEKKIELLEKEQQMNKELLIVEKENRTVALIFISALFIAIITLLFINNQKLVAKNKLIQQEKQIKKEKILTSIRELELKLIQDAINVQETERERISQEIHDMVGGNLASIKLNLSDIKKSNKKFNLLKDQLDQTTDLVRVKTKNLMSEEFYHKGFAMLIKDYLNKITATFRLTTTFNSFPEREINGIHNKLRTEIFTIIRELLANTVLHAKATTVDLQISLLDKTILILFEDNGIGFKTNNAYRGSGLNVIKRKINKLQGVFQIDSILEQGTILTIEIPVHSKV